MKITISISVDPAVQENLQADAEGLMNELIDTVITRSINEGYHDVCICTDLELEEGAGV